MALRTANPEGCPDESTNGKMFIFVAWIHGMTRRPTHWDGSSEVSSNG